MPSFWMRNPTKIADRPMIAPTDRSIPRPIITKDSPSARNAMTTESAKMKARLLDAQKYGCAAVDAATTMTMTAVTRISRRRSSQLHRGGTRQLAPGGRRGLDVPGRRHYAPTASCPSPSRVTASPASSPVMRPS